eukprot:scaffold4202_cov121-Skeletonema_dohrnii-CCMP3373.AAC.4
MATDLIVDFPLQRQRNHQAVRFDERVQLYIVERHEDNEDKNKLWYTKSDYNSMKRKLKQDVLQARAGEALSEEDSGFWIGIAHLLTPACMLEVKACRFLCVRAVLAEQARQSPSTSFRWENIALASLAETRKAVLRARKLGKLHQESI